MADGYIKLYRSITENWVWEEKPFSKGQAWVDLLLMANHTDGKFLFGNELVNVSAGDVITSTVKLAERWGWSRHKVMSFLDVLEGDAMLSQKKDSKRTYLTLCNYKDFNEAPTAKGQQKDSKRTAQGHQKDTIKNVKNEKNEKNINKLNPLTPFEIAVEQFKEFRESIKKPMTEKAVELLHSKLDSLAGDNEDLKIKIIEQSIFRGWQGVFELKEGGGNGGTKSNGAIRTDNSSDTDGGSTWNGYKLFGGDESGDNE